MRINESGKDGKVVLIASPKKIYTDIAARFCRSPKELDEIVASPYNKELVEQIINSGHLAATEFDWWIFGVSGYSRVTETQLVRKRLASYLISSGRHEGKRNYEITLPKSIIDLKDELVIDDPIFAVTLEQYLNITENVYEWLLEHGVKPEEARFLKPLGTSFKAMIGMNTHALMDWFKIRMCNRAQSEIRDMATKMYNLCFDEQPDVFKFAGPSCKVLGYCPESEGCGKAPSLQALKDAYVKVNKPKKPRKKKNSEVK